MAKFYNKERDHPIEWNLVAWEGSEGGACQGRRGGKEERSGATVFQINVLETYK